MGRIDSIICILPLLYFSLCSVNLAQANLMFKGRLPYPVNVPISERYPEEVALYSSLGIHPKSGFDLILHLHGYRLNRDHLNGRLENFNDVLEEFRFDTLLANSGRKAILAVPSSLGKCETYESYLMDDSRLDLFFKAVFKKLGAYPNRIILIGHSGAYRSLSSITRSSYGGFASELYLLDAAYGEEEAFFDFVHQARHRFVSAFRKDTVTAERSYLLWSLLRSEFPPASTLDQFYRETLPSTVSANQIPRGGASFIMTDGDHWRVVNDYWSRLISTTASAPVRE